MKNCPNCFATNSYKKVYKEDKNIYVCEYCGSVSEDYTIRTEKIIKEYVPVETMLETEKKTYYYREVTPSKWPKKLALILISMLGVWIFGQSMVLIFSEEEKPTKQISTITPEEFQKLKIGMSEETVINIVGGAPLNSDRDKRNYKGENGVEENSRVLLEFYYGKLKAKYEFGLITKKKYE
ncbi:TFIIB-type zinc ribbon-containing protein [Lysinibacillus sphaericus]|uniref:Uncharacterized protein n=1 Tax=Lysinibacillus sphaericus OT4b.31 TaxID=1285586 RepID=R7ZCW2_LYSSH|nr:TFIIB-type zinc ribbon-containing protein [Lysinibacillus sphaericus]EON71864.1 hypothetical protein H131_13008 [Lysinibacillus sphaericus OT4b.31]